jgi:hypothetical protein
MANFGNYAATGIEIDNSVLPFSIKTSQAEAFIQKKVDFACETMKIKKTEVNLITSDVSEFFKPFIVCLPTYALSGGQQKQKGPQMSGIFNIENNQKHAGKLNEPWDSIFAPMVYNSADVAMFDSQHFQNQMRIRRESVISLKRNYKPSIAKLSGGQRMVILLLDPIRVFHAMLEDSLDSRPFAIDLTKTKSVGNGEYIYKMNRRIINNKKGGKYNVTVVDELNRKMRGR